MRGILSGASMTRLITSTALATLLATSPALADLTPEGAFAMFRAQLEAMGLEVEADSHREGDTLTVSEIRTGFEIPSQDMQFGMTLGAMTYTQNDDGSVAVDLSLPYAITLSGKGDLDPTFSGFHAVMEIDGESYSGTLTGDPDHTKGTWQTSPLTLALTDLSIDGDNADAMPVFEAAGSFSPMRWDTQNAIEDAAVTFNMNQHTPSDTTMSMLGKSPDGATTLLDNIAIYTGQTSTVSMALPREGLNVLRLHEQLRDGLMMQFETRAESYESRDYTEEVLFEDTTIRTTTEMASSDFEQSLSLDATGFSAQGKAGTGRVKFSSQGMPGFGFIIGFALEEAWADMHMPLLTADMAQPFRLGFGGENITLSDETWAQFDPETLLDRSPMRLKLDASGTLDILTDIADATALSMLDSTPVLPRDVTINALELEAMGARLTGEGAANLDLATQPMATEGAFALRLLGANKLFDQVQAAGIASAEEISGARMMLGIFGRAGEGDDEVLSDIEIKGSGEVHVNGQRIR
jgi:hypothetical protein